VKEFADALEKESNVLVEGSSSPRTVIKEEEKPNCQDKATHESDRKMTKGSIAQEMSKDSDSLPCDIRGEDSAKGISEISSLPSLDLEVTAANFKEEKRSEATDDIGLMSQAKGADVCTVDQDDLEDVDVNKIIDDLGSEKVTICSYGKVSSNTTREDNDADWDEDLSADEKLEATADEELNGDEKSEATADEELNEDEKSEATADEWDILDDVAQQIESDAALARAASLVGSALFEDSQKEATSYTLPRWSTELKKLHELGFLDDSSSVEVLDSLNAANIGSGVTDPIKIEKVVERLLEKEA
jgi:hypothetical protein